MPHTTAWMTVTPNAGLGQRLENTDYRLLMNWWLGRALLPTRDGPAVCPHCEGAADSFGDHFVSCKHNQPVQRHHALRDALHGVLTEQGISASKEVTVSEHRRPADLALHNFDARGQVAVDLVVHHPLGLSAALSGDPKASLRRAEEEKTLASEALCHSVGWLFTAMGWHPWAGLGPRGTTLLRKLEGLVTTGQTGWLKTSSILSLRSRLSFALMAFVAKQLRAVEDTILQPALLPPSDATTAAVPVGPLFSDQDLGAWETEEPFLSADLA